MFGLKGSDVQNSEHCLLKNVGISEFNKQHLRLASYAVEFSQLVEELATREPENKDWRQVDALFSRISRFVATHFREEEELMRVHAYPDYAAHKVLHEKFAKQLAEVQSQINSRNIKFKGKLTDMLWGWLYHHINEVDYEYRDFFMEKGIK
ncbi:MAG: hemerythrin family protein [Gammaproteobacteria bacterium]|nr:hemerythrin family protein [Gammaproteobacteria bacterium]